MVRAFVSVFDDVWRLIQPDQAFGSNHVGVALSAATSKTFRSPLEGWFGMLVSSAGIGRVANRCLLARRNELLVIDFLTNWIGSHEINQRSSRFPSSGMRY
jgi:hypothetical protein